MTRSKLTLFAFLAAVVGLLCYLSAPTQKVAQFDGTPPDSPAEVEALPDGAGFGYAPDPEATKEFLQAFPGGRSALFDQAPQLFEGTTEDSPVLLYRALNIAYEQRYPGSKWVVEKQGIGDCVSHGWKHGVDIHLAVLKVTGEVSEWKPAATEAIYGGSRVEARGRRSGGWSDGSYGSAAAKFVRDWGVVFREDYTSRAGSETDLTRYSPRKAKDWGNYGCGGRDDQGRLDGICKEHPIKSVALVTNWEETKAALRNGYPIPVCSGQGFASRTDRDGFAAARGSWAHCMCAIGIRFDREGVLILNSWGPNWIDQSGGRYPDDMPRGAFWCERSTWERMLRGRDSFAVAGAGGFKKRTLKNSAGW